MDTKITKDKQSVDDVTFNHNLETSSVKSIGINNEAYTVQTPTVYRVTLSKSNHNNEKFLNQTELSSLSENSSANDNRSLNILTSSKRARNENDFIVKRQRKFLISYESMVWCVFAIVTILCIVDRFVDKGDIVLKRQGKRVSKMWGSSFAQTATNVIWGITARLLITSQNLMFYTTLWCFPNILAEYAPRFLKFDGIRDIHIKIHRIAGIFLVAIPSLAHVLVIFVPPLINKSQLTFHPPNEFNYSQQLGHLNWTKFWDPAAVNNWSFNDVRGVHLTADEIYRLVLMIALFCILIPLSRSQYLNHRSYSTAIALHTFGGVWYAVDNIRKITHGLAHVMNLPFLILWCIDRLISIIYYHTSSASIVNKNVIGEKYIEVRLKMNDTVSSSIGDVYYLSTRKTKFGIPACERSHPFTSFSNHSSADRSWDIGFLMSIMDDDDQWFPAWTRRMFNLEANQGSLPLKVWGPYRSSSFELYKSLTNNRQDDSTYILFASGSGIGYLIDVLDVLAHKTKCFKNRKTKIHIYYTVREMAVIEQFYVTVLNFIKEIKREDYIDVSFHWYCTDNLAKFQFDALTHKNISCNQGRVNFEQIISKAEKSASVYFVGRPSIADQLLKICSKYGIDVHKDFVNSQRGRSDKQVMINYFKISLLVLAVTVGLCLILSIYIHM